MLFIAKIWQPGRHERIWSITLTMLIEISIRELREVTILDLRGTCTLDCGSELLSGQVRRLFDNGACNLLLNLEGLTQVDSSGISVLIEMCLSARRNGGNVKLLRPHNRVRMVLNLFRLLDVIPNFEDETQALASFFAPEVPSQKTKSSEVCEL